MESALIVPNAVILETRQLWWNIDAPFARILFYFLILVATGILIHGVYKKIAISGTDWFMFSPMLSCIRKPLRRRLLVLLMLVCLLVL
jgi:hypothetical protein